MTGEAGPVPDDVREAIAEAISRADNEWGWAARDPELHGGALVPPWQQYVAGAVLAVPAVAEVFAKAALFDKVRRDAVWMAKLAQGASWPAEMAHRVDQAANRVIEACGTDADRAVIAALFDGGDRP